MIFNPVMGSSAPNGNEISYPVSLPENTDKLYNEVAINDIAVAIDSSTLLKVSEMPDAIRALHEWGIVATNLSITTVEYTIENYSGA